MRFEAYMIGEWALEQVGAIAISTLTRPSLRTLLRREAEKWCSELPAHLQGGHTLWTEALLDLDEQGRELNEAKRSLIDALKRRVPTDAEVYELLLGIQENPDRFVGMRRWFAAAYEAYVGLRAEGVAGMRIGSLEDALRDAGLTIPQPLSLVERSEAASLGWTGGASALENLSRWPSGQHKLIQSLVDYGNTIDFLYITVVEKGGKDRRVRIPVWLFRETLRQWIWDLRAQFIEAAQKRRSSWQDPNDVWLSRTREAGVVAGTLSNEMKIAFQAVASGHGPVLSGHRLRAYYLNGLVRSLYRKALALHGRMLSAEAILREAADIAGHSDPRSLKWYLDQQMAEGLALEGYAIMVVDKHQAELLRGFAEALSDRAEGLFKSLQELAARKNIIPVVEPASGQDAIQALARHEERLRVRSAPS